MHSIPSNNLDNRKDFMRQETNADLQKKIEKRGVLITVLLFAMLAVGIVLLLKWTSFFLGLFLGAVIVAAIRFTDSDDLFDYEA